MALANCSILTNYNGESVTYSDELATGWYACDGQSVFHLHAPDSIYIILFVILSILSIVLGYKKRSHAANVFWITVTLFPWTRCTKMFDIVKQTISIMLELIAYWRASPEERQRLINGVPTVNTV